MEEENAKPDMSNAEMMAIELKPWRPRFPKLSIWLYARQWGFHISALYYVAIALVLILTGIAVANWMSDGIWFSRFGSLIIVVGIGFGIHGVEGRVDSDIRYCNEILKAIEEDEFEAKKRANDGSFERTPELVTDIMIHSFTKAFSGRREKNSAARIKRNTFRIDAAIAVMGTLIWGFGDLLFK
ncbi:MAG: hypothetical protein AAGC74_11420 [Verrucomicrobiota bacterium]